MRNLAKQVKAYGSPDHKRSFGQVLVTATGFVGLWFAMWFALDLGYWATLLLAIPTAGLMVRLFILQHDCGHGSLFRSRRLNDAVGRAIGVVTLTPYDYWRRSHAIHHANSGNLDHRGIGDVEMRTVREYLALSPFKRLMYRAYRSPLVLFVIGPIWLFAFKHRLPLDLPLRRNWLWLSILLTDLAIVGLTVGMGSIVGFADVAMVQAPVMMVASSVGVWLFFIQHQYEPGYWRNDAKWDFHEAAVHGSSHYELPKILHWFTANIGLHHIHHLSSRVPNYRLQECLDKIPALQDSRRLTILESLKCARLTLWDEDSQKMIGFRELKRIAAPDVLPA